jgi:hypothetical protein
MMDISRIDSSAERGGELSTATICCLAPYCGRTRQLVRRTQHPFTFFNAVRKEKKAAFLVLMFCVCSQLK